MIKITVVLASYNGEQFIREQINSVLMQRDIELFLLDRDDGSSDATQMILDEYQKNGLLKWYTGDHLNVAKGFLDLLLNAPESTYYAFCDQDDVWKENKLSAAIEKLGKENNNIPLMYYSASTLVDENLKFISEHNVHKQRTDEARFLINDMSGNTIVINNKLRNLICSAINEPIVIHDKWALQVCLANGGKCINDSNSYILYRQHLSNTIGMELNLKDKISKFFKIVKLPPDPHLRILYNLYGKDLTSPYAEIVFLAIESNGKLPISKRLSFMKKYNIDFDDFFFNLAFFLRLLRGVI